MNLLSVLTTLAGVVIAIWAIFRLGQTGRRGEWVLKCLVLAIFAFAVLWVCDRLIPQFRWRFDNAGVMVSIAAYLLWGWWMHERGDRRGKPRGQHENGAAPH